MFSLIAATFLVVFASYVECGSLPSEQIISSASVDVSSNAAPVSVESRQKSCWELIVDGRRLHPQFIVRSVWAATLLDCQRECEDVLFNCETIAFGQSPVKNTTCDLSDWEAASLSVQPYSTDTILAPTYNVYSRYGRYPNEPHDERRCNRFSSAHDSTSYRPVPTKLVGGATTFSEDVCYSVVFTGRRLSHRYIERSIAVVSLEECKLLCTRETSFDCRSFNYRRRLSSTNCDLSREDSASLDITSSRVFISDPEVDFYQRVGKGQGCFRPYGRPPTSTSGNEYYYTGSNSPVALVTQRPSVNLPAITTSINECYRRLKSGYRIEPRIVRDSINVRSLYECQTECHRSRIFLCRTFSFRQSSGGYNPGGNNCELSDLDPRDLDPVRHLVVDRDADIYERSMVGRNCRDTPVTTWNNYRPNKPNSLCFLRTKSGVRLERRAIRHTVTVHTPMECEQECINAQYFTCRSFSYRFSPSATHADAYHKTHDNCDMSDIDLNSLDPLRDLIDDRLYDSWQRTSYSRDCDLGSYRLPDTSGDGYFYRDDEDFYSLLNPWYHYIQHPLTYTSSATSRCYSSYRRGFRMSQRLVRDSIHVRNLAECEQECSRTRPFTCQTFHFRYTNTDGGYDRNPYNCELSDFSARDFDRFRDMVEDRDYELFTRSQFSSCTYGFTEASSSELSPILASSSSEVTVSGLRCRAGSRCRPHRELGYWYCEINDSHNYNNNWDYCCQPQSRCGYSNGFHYPWCYVGTEASGQWRPCSDRYAERPYAYLHRKLPPNATEPANRPPTKNVEDFIRPILSNSAEISRSNQHIIVKINCTTESPDHQDSVDPELLEEK